MRASCRNSTTLTLSQYTNTACVQVSNSSLDDPGSTPSFMIWARPAPRRRSLVLVLGAQMFRLAGFQSYLSTYTLLCRGIQTWLDHAQQHIVAIKSRPNANLARRHRDQTSSFTPGFNQLEQVKSWRGRRSACAKVRLLFFRPHLRVRSSSGTQSSERNAE